MFFAIAVNSRSTCGIIQQSVHPPAVLVYCMNVGCKHIPGIHHCTHGGADHTRRLAVPIEYCFTALGRVREWQLIPRLCRGLHNINVSPKVGKWPLLLRPRADAPQHPRLRGLDQSEETTQFASTSRRYSYTRTL